MSLLLAIPSLAKCLIETRVSWFNYIIVPAPAAEYEMFVTVAHSDDTLVEKL